MTDPDVTARLADLERRVAALEGTSVSSSGEGSGGTVGYEGRTHLHGDLEWSIVLDARAVLQVDGDPGVTVLSALAHPVRAAIVRNLLDAGPTASAALADAVGAGSAGKLYHHLRSLVHAGLVEQDARGSYRVPARATVPVLVVLAAAADVAGQWRAGSASGR